MIDLLIKGQDVCAYVHSLTDTGLPKRWPISINPISVFYDATTHTQAMSSDEILSIYNESVLQWNKNSEQKIHLKTRSLLPTNFYGSIQFSNNYPGLGSGVLGLTVTTSDESTGSILKADIYLNDQVEMSSTQGDIYYLGDILTHELGHLLGLSHSPVKGATMYYQWVSGQTALHTDDIAGMEAIYPTGSKKTITGQVIAGMHRYGILGTHVMAISAATGNVYASALSDEDGHFSISGLSPDETYYLYLAPLKTLSPLPKYYSTSKTNFCNEQKNYLGSFYQACAPSLKGYPVPIVLNQSGVGHSLGQITINCGLDTPPQYADSRDDFFDLLNFNPFTPRYQGSLVGRFTLNEVDSLTEDLFSLDLTGMFPGAIPRYLKVNVITMSLYSPLETSLKIDMNGGERTYTAYSRYAEDGINNDLSINIPLSSESSKNHFELTIKALNQSLYDYDSAYYEEVEDYSFYQLTYGLYESYDGVTMIPLNQGIDSQFGDNYSCPGAQEAYPVNAWKTSISVYSSQNQQNNDSGGPLDFLGCGSISIVKDQGPKGPGPMSGAVTNLVIFIMGVVLSYLVNHLFKYCRIVLKAS